MPVSIRLSQPGLRVLRAFLDAYAESVRAELTGSDIMRAAGLPSGTLYPILLRFEKAGVLTSRWEQEKPEALGRPRRRYYQITPSGAEFAKGALQDLFTPLDRAVPGEA